MRVERRKNTIRVIPINPVEKARNNNKKQEEKRKDFLEILKEKEDKKEY